MARLSVSIRICTSLSAIGCRAKLAEIGIPDPYRFRNELVMLLEGHLPVAKITADGKIGVCSPVYCCADTGCWSTDCHKTSGVYRPTEIDICGCAWERILETDVEESMLKRNTEDDNFGTWGADAFDIGGKGEGGMKADAVPGSHVVRKVVVSVDEYLV